MAEAKTDKTTRAPRQPRVGRLIDRLFLSPQEREKRESARRYAERVFKPKRVDIMTNQDFSSMGGAVLQQPDPRVIEMIKAEEPRARYFPVASSQEFAAVELGGWGSVLNMDELYRKTVLKLLEDQVRQDFPDQRIGLRGTQVALNGSILVGDRVVMDVVDVIRRGNDRREYYPLIEDGLDTGGDKPIIVGYPSEYVSKTPIFRKKIERSGREGEVFPAIIVYDQSKISPVRSINRSVSESFERHVHPNAVLALYVLDAPVLAK